MFNQKEIIRITIDVDSTIVAVLLAEELLQRLNKSDCSRQSLRGMSIKIINQKQKYDEDES